MNSHDDARYFGPTLGVTVGRVSPAARSLALALALAAGCARPQLPADRRPLTSEQRANNLAAFDEVWMRVDQTYFNPARLAGGEGNLDWAAIRTKLRPRAEKAATLHEARAAIETLISRLGETHFALLPAEGVDIDPRERPLGEVGITLRVIDGQAIVWRVERDSPAAQAGVQAGWTLLQVEDTRLAPLIRVSSPPTTRAVARATRRAQDSLAVTPQRRITAVFVDFLGHGHTLHMTAVAREQDIAQLGDLPPMSLRIESATLAGGVGYFSLSSFLDPPRVMPAFETFIRVYADAPGLIVDLRGNPGGISGMASGIAGFFVDREGASLGTMVTREDHLPFAINPRYPNYRGKLAILVDGQSESTSEILAAGLQDLGRARIFGEPTPGAALPSTIMTLANGDRFQYAIADFIRPSGRRLEGVGVRPDELVPLTRSALLANLDSPLERAIDWIRSPAATTRATTQAAEEPSDDRDPSHGGHE